MLWFTLGTAVSLAFMEIGGGYAFAGQGATPLPAAFRVILLGGHLPGGFHAHGGIMVVLGLSNLWGLASLSQRYSNSVWHWVQWTGYCIIGYSIWLASAFAGAIYITGQYSAGFWFYIFIAIVALAKTILPPPWRDSSSASSSLGDS
jgi:hypothetical protein